MSRLVLIRHSKTEPGDPAEGTDWPLSNEGKALCEPLAEVLREIALDVLISSRMLRARQTAEVISARLGIPWRCADGLEEHRRPFVTEPDAFFSLSKRCSRNRTEQSSATRPQTRWRGSALVSTTSWRKRPRETSES
jgi:phosphohistidine phosphatase SixA